MIEFMPKLIIEIGLNHLGKEAAAWKMLQESIKTKADAVTFQVREDAFYDPDKPYRGKLPDKFYARAVKAIKESGKKAGIAIASSRAVDFFSSLSVDFWKTLSWDLGNGTLQNVLQKTGKPVYISTGLSNMEEIANASGLYKNIIFIHTQLSQKTEDVNLKAISTIRSKTGRAVAFGLHCPNPDVIKMAAALEPEAIFFYIKQKNSEFFYDNEHAVAIDQLGRTVDDLKNLCLAIGDGSKNKTEVPKWVEK
jgi:sialic acid synthase SpsE